LKAANYDVVAHAEPSVVVGSHMLEDVARILAMTAEQRMQEIKNVSRFLHDVRRV